MTANIDTRTVESSDAAEIYISATPKEPGPFEDQARQAFSGIRDTLRSRKAYLLQERVFATQEVMKRVLRARSEAYGDTDDGVAPSALCGAEGTVGPFTGVQIHAVTCDTRLEVVSLEGTPCGRIVRVPGRVFVSLSNISAPQFTEATEQARAMMEKGESVLKELGADFLCVPRTWMWLRDILSWYGDFNHVRNTFFTERGLIGQGSRQSMPASTGIGVYSADGSKCAMDLIAVLEPADSIQYLAAVGKQQCALEYGSAFSRASRAATPAAETVFVSGTASIDASGATTNVGDAVGQINATIENVRAVLRDMQVNDEDVVQVMSYCKTTEVERIFNDIRGRLPWPWVTAICDICRPDLLFEIEATAVPASSTKA